MRSVNDDGGIPESDAIHVSPAVIGSDVVNVPVLMMSPAFSVSAPRRFVRRQAAPRSRL